MLKILIYMFFVIITIYALDSLNYEKIFKPNKIIQARLLFFIVALSLSYLATNFFYDFFLNSKII